jgi:diguanylate cyclase (GGDEF)-like protein
VAAVLPSETASIIQRGVEQALQRDDLQSVFLELPVEGSIHHYEARIAPNGPDKVVIVVRDITLQKHNEEKIRRLAYFDTLTGLPNRQSFLERLDRELLRARRTNRRMALLFLDLDGFKRINDTLGHSAGDCLLQTVADRLQEKLRAGAFIARPALDESGLHFARLGGDEFTVVLPDVDTAETACVVARRIQALLAQAGPDRRTGDRGHLEHRHRPLPRRRRRCRDPAQARGYRDVLRQGAGAKQLAVV